MLVALRLTIGAHFFYEGVWKINNADKFSAKPFLTMAKGPAAPLYYAMVPDINGERRLAISEDDKGQPVIKGETYLKAWQDLLDRVVDKYKLGDDQQKEAGELFERYEDSLDEYLADNLEDITAYFGALERHREHKAAGNNGAAHQKKRIWDEQMKLRGEAGGWLNEIEGMGDDYAMALWNVLDDDQKASGDLPRAWTMSDFMDFAVTWGLTAIGFCLIVGFCNRLACLGGAVFLINVLLTQPPWPAIYPPAPSVVGHALIIDKNFVEMVAMVMLATTAVGRWGGLDYFLHHWLGRPIEAYLEQKCKK